MYLFMGVLWGHFSSSNSPGILAQELDIHICVDEFFSVLGVTWLSLYMFRQSFDSELRLAGRRFFFHFAVISTNIAFQTSFKFFRN